MGITLEAYHQILQDASGHKIFSIEDMVAGTESVTESLTEQISGPLDELEIHEFKVALGEAVSGLPEREQLVMSLYYDEELNLRQIGGILGVSESRVCQIHGQALVRLKSRLAQWRVSA